MCTVIKNIAHKRLWSQACGGTADHNSAVPYTRGLRWLADAVIRMLFIHAVHAYAGALVAEWIVSECSVSAVAMAVAFWARRRQISFVFLFALCKHHVTTTLWWWPDSWAHSLAYFVPFRGRFCCNPQTFMSIRCVLSHVTKRRKGCDWQLSWKLHHCYNFNFVTMTTLMSRLNIPENGEIFVSLLPNNLLFLYIGLFIVCFGACLVHSYMWISCLDSWTSRR